MLLLFDFKLKVVILSVLSHQIQKNQTITRVKEVIVNHTTVDVNRVEKGTRNDGSRNPVPISVEMNAFAG